MSSLANTLRRFAPAGAATLALGMAGQSLAQVSCMPAATRDWMKTADSLAVAVQPADCAETEQTPPEFTWPDLGASVRYEVMLAHSDGRTVSKAAPANWIAWGEPLPPGTYQWQVRAIDARGRQDSQVRRFSVSRSAVPFIPPDLQVLYQRTIAKAHPRAVPDPAVWAAMTSQRRGPFGALVSEVDGKLRNALPEDPARGIEDAVHQECKRILNASLAYLVTGNERHLAEAQRRAINAANWNVSGPTGYANRDQASNELLFTLSLAYDWLAARLGQSDKNMLLRSIRARGEALYQGAVVRRAGGIASHPYNSHAAHGLILLAAASTLVAGDLAEAQKWARDALPLAVHFTGSWGGEDGGYGNGTAQGTWDNGGSLVPWYVLRWASGLDLAAKAWVRNYSRYLAYFVPPGTPAGNFGDGNEYRMTEDWARYGKGHAAYAPTPLARWYASQLKGEDTSRLESLLAPPLDNGPAPFPAGTAHGAFFPSIGWAAMHSDLRDPQRVSVYFRSSPFGALNHSHADQNSFVINARGQRLAIASGYYDDYKSTHWKGWYKQTLAHNAITFDGGRGQLVDVNDEATNKGSTGTITQWRNADDAATVAGDATRAYGGALTRARRALAYLRPDLVLVYDELASSTPRQWEWNIHALQPMKQISDSRISIQANGESLCVDMLKAPPAAFSQHDAFTAAPEGRNTPRQWHGAFVSERTAKAEFIALLRVGCTPAAASVQPAADGWSIKVRNRLVAIRDGAATVTVAAE